MKQSDFFDTVNGSAARLHYLQGQSLRHFERGLPHSFFEEEVDYLTWIYQSNFTATKQMPDGLHYIAFPKRHHNKYKLNGSYRAIFEVRWFVSALLGIALARQAVAIHKEPHGLEPESADRRLVKMVNSFMREATPDKGLQKIEEYKSSLPKEVMS